RPDLLDVPGLELRKRPFALVEVHLRERLGRVDRDLEQESVGVSEHDRPPKRREPVEHLAGLVAALHRVAAADHTLDARALGLDWDGPVTFQLDRLDDCRRVAEQLVAEGKAYEDEGAIRFRMPDEGVTAWDDAVRGRVEFPNEQLEDVVLVRGDGRPTYNFA